MTRLIACAALPLALVLFAGCSREGDSGGKTYSFKGQVTAVDAGKKTVTVAHEEIPGLMKAMTMTFSVEDAKLLDGLTPGSGVEGMLKVASGKYTVTDLHKIAPPTVAAPLTDAEKEEAAIKANLAKLGVEDRKIAEAQRMCPVGCRLGDEGMGVPVKLIIKGEPVFIGCKGCKEDAEKNPDETLKKVAELKKTTGKKD